MRSSLVVSVIPAAVQVAGEWPGEAKLGVGGDD